jgi:hypothetical protein
MAESLETSFQKAIAATATTVEVRGVQVLAHKSSGSPITYANRTQAQKKVDEMGSGWMIYRWTRPFYVGRAKTFVLHHNWTGNWSGSAKFGFSAPSIDDARSKAIQWAHYHGFTRDSVKAEEVSDLPPRVQMHDEYLRS